MFRGLRANNTPRQAPSCPKRRPPRPKQPVFTGFCRGGLHCGHYTTSNRDLTVTKRGGIALHDAPTRRRYAEEGLHVVQNPHHHRHRGRRRARHPENPWVQTQQPVPCGNTQCPITPLCRVALGRWSISARRCSILPFADRLVSLSAFWGGCSLIGQHARGTNFVSL